MKKVTNADALRILPQVQELLDSIDADVRGDEKTEVIHVRLSSLEKATIRSKAMKSGLDLSTFVRETMLERIAKIEML